MADFLHGLESRRLFSGGIDSSFGSTAGATFTPPPNATVLDSAIDSGDRPVFVGKVKISDDGDGNETDQMFIARLDGAGQLDSSFPGGGISQGTPRGITRLTHVIALNEGGYLASGVTAGGNVLARFTAAGRLDSSYGRNGVLHTTINIQAVLERTDGTVIIVGDDSTHPVISEDNDADDTNYAMHITQKGSIDKKFGGNGNGYAFLGDATWGDDFTEVSNPLNSATLDDSSRLVLGLNTSIAKFPDGDSDANAGQSAVGISRFNTDGSPDPTFIAGQQFDGHLYYEAQVDQHSSGDQVPVGIDGVIATLPEGRVVALSRDDQAPTQAPRLTLVNNSANADQSKVTIDLSTLSTHFAVPNLSDHDLLVIPGDDSVLIAGAMISGSKQTPAVIKLEPNLKVDTHFGSGGILKFGTAGANESAGSLRLAADGTVYAIASSAAGGERTGAITAARIFLTDNPIVRLHKAKRFGDTERITVNISGVNPIDTASLDDHDMQLIMQNSGEEKKLRLVRFMQNADGSATAIYRIKSNLLSAGTYDIVPITNQILDTKQHGNVQVGLGQLIL